MFRSFRDVALTLGREWVGQNASSTGGILVSQKVKAPFVMIGGVVAWIGLWLGCATLRSSELDRTEIGLAMRIIRLTV